LQNTTLPYYFIFLFLFAFANQSLAKEQANSLSNKARSAKIEEYLSIVKKNLRINSSIAWDAIHKAKDLSIGFDEKKLLECNLNIAQIYQQKGVLDSALMIINDALLISEEQPVDSLRGEMYHALGLNYQFSGSIDLALESYHKALNINEKLGLIAPRMRQLNNIGLLYREEEEYDLAMEYLEECLRISRDNGLEKYQFFSYGNIGYILMKQNKWEEALERFEETIKLTYYQNDSLGSCSINYLISDVKLNLNDFEGAKRHANKALSIANQVDYALGKVFSQRVLSETYLREKKYDKARNLAQETLNYIKSNSANLYLEDILDVLYDIEYETGNYKEALEIHQQITTRRDSLHKVKIKEKISNSEYKYQLFKNEQENKLLKVENESNQRTSFLAIVVAFLLGLLVLSALYAYQKSRDNNEILEKAINVRTQELAKSNKNLAQSNSELERFAYIASHDLKTPLRDIVSFTGLLERQLKNHEDKNVHEFLAFIKKGGIRLNKLISDTLEYSKLSAHEEYNLTQVVDLNILFNELKNSISSFIIENNAEVIIQKDLPSLYANGSKLILLFQNLIENGIKYNNSPTPTINIYTDVKTEYISIFVQDNGIGISDEFKEEIFVMFSRLHNQNEYEGTGLGLSICKKIIEKFKGEFHLQSEIDKGSTFEIRLARHLFIEKN